MRNIIDLYEASLLDIEDTIKNGDLIVKEFDDMKKAMLNKNNWIVAGSVNYIQLFIFRYRIPEIYKLLNCYEAGDQYIEFYCERPVAWKLYRGHLRLYGSVDSSNKELNFENTTNVKLPLKYAKYTTDVIKQLKNTILKDLNSFVDFINTNIE